ncbi:MAG TPA: hypothetical protein VN709_06995 [Terriglobales bacterium]|nr:hypothetical protein [Terriglobales bacterium]
MQTLGLDPAAGASEGFFRRLFYPTIQTDFDVDEATRRGFWICVICAGASLLLRLMQPAVAVRVGGLVDAMFILLAGMGSRMRNRFAAVLIFAMIVIVNTLRGSWGILPVLIAVLLLSNARATWIAANSRPHGAIATPIPAPAESLILTPDGEPMPLPWTVRIADILVPRLWPWVKYLFYVLAGFEILGIVIVIFSRAALSIH